MRSGGWPTRGKRRRTLGGQARSGPSWLCLAWRTSSKSARGGPRCQRRCERLGPAPPSARWAGGVRRSSERASTSSELLPSTGGDCGQVQPWQEPPTGCASLKSLVFEVVRWRERVLPFSRPSHPLPSHSHHHNPTRPGRCWHPSAAEWVRTRVSMCSSAQENRDFGVQNTRNLCVGKNGGRFRPGECQKRSSKISYRSRLRRTMATRGE